MHCIAEEGLKLGIKLFSKKEGEAAGSLHYAGCSKDAWNIQADAYAL